MSEEKEKPFFETHVKQVSKVNNMEPCGRCGENKSDGFEHEDYPLPGSRTLCLECFDKINTSLKGYKTSTRFTDRDWAAIHLKVPESGTPWLDEMIEKSRRDEFAKTYLVAIFNNKEFLKNAADLSVKKEMDYNSLLSKSAYQTADALLAESKKKKEE